MANPHSDSWIRSRAASTAVLIAMVVAGLLLGSGCQRWKLTPVSDRLQPSNDRDWSPEQRSMPFADVDGSVYALRNIRNCRYLSVDDYVVEYYDRQIELSQIQSVDFIVVPFKKAPALAHTMLSFGLDDGTYLVVSVEVRKEKDEKYNVLAGLTRKFELIYVLGDERDLIGVRARHYESDVFVYPSTARPEQAQKLFAEIVERMNLLVADPEFYNSVTNNCTTNLKDHVNRLAPEKIRWDWKVLLPGYSAKHAYDAGLLDNRIPFKDLESMAYVNDLVEKYFEDPQFSQRIRSNRDKIDRYAQREANRQSVITSAGQDYLDSQTGRQGLIRR